LVNKIAKKEGFSIDTGVADLIGLLGDGSFRDTLGILQKVISSSSDKKISMKEVEEITGAPRGELVNNFISSLAYGDRDQAFLIILKVKEANISIKTFISLILEKIRIILILKNVNSISSVESLKQSVSEDDWVILEKISKDEKSKVGSSMLRELLKAYDMTSYSYIETLPLEIAIVDIVL
jgi:DNA polymerase-3 subunit gamma/tau